MIIRGGALSRNEKPQLFYNVFVCFGEKRLSAPDSVFSHKSLVFLAF